MGVCPQFDILWNELTGAEHLSIYANVKGLPWRSVAQESSELLEKVGCWEGVGWGWGSNVILPCALCRSSVCLSGACISLPELVSMIYK